VSRRKPVAEGHPSHVAVRLDPATIDRVDALVPALTTPWRQATRSDVLRMLVLAGLETKEGASPIKPRPGSGLSPR
jgi:hypothetical protein